MNIEYKEKIQQQNQVFDADNQVIISIVTIGELKALAMRNGWGNAKISLVLNFLQNFIILSITAQDITDKYAEIDTFSQGKHPTMSHNLSARNMGKNDLWIAASAAITQSTLLTFDKDFEHLQYHFLDIIIFE